jgi:hypothetical protein
MLFSFVYPVFVSLLKLLIGSRRPAQVKDIQLMAQHQQLDVLRPGRSAKAAICWPRLPRRGAAWLRTGAAMICSSPHSVETRKPPVSATQPPRRGCPRYPTFVQCSGLDYRRWSLLPKRSMLRTTHAAGPIADG